MSEVQHIKEILPTLMIYFEDRVRQIVREEIEAKSEQIPAEVVGATAISKIIRVHGVGNKYLSPKTISNYAATGRIPVKGRTRAGKSFRIVFDTEAVLEWDRLGRPDAVEVMKDRV